MKRMIPLLVLLVAACNQAEKPIPATATAPQASIPANADHGKELIAQYGCTVCHTIPGTEGPQGQVGPSLSGVGSRTAISGGRVPNTPENLVSFIQNPASMNPQSSMPPLGVAPGDARDIAAYLHTLK